MKFEFSAGGIVYKKAQKKIYILVAQHALHHGWVFPKGLIGDHVENEGKEETAVREVKEETGIDAKILKPFPPVTYWYQFEGQKIKKTVYYYLMAHIGGDFQEKDHEMEAVEWIPEEQVAEKLTYKSDKQVWEQARELLAQSS